MAASLRARLLLWVMVPLGCAVAVDAWTSLRDAQATATVVQDRMLLGSARIIAEQLHYEDGTLQQNIPPAALELFESLDIDRVYYRVTTEDGQLVTGYEEIALPASAPPPEVPQFFASAARGAPVRVVALLQPVLTDAGEQNILVEVAQTRNGHRALARELWLHGVTRQLLIVALAALFVLFGLHLGLKPLLHLRTVVLARKPGAGGPLPSLDAPHELAPLIGAFNQYAQRIETFADAQRVFIQNAAHQLRTPLTLLATQVGYAVRSDSPAARLESLRAIEHSVSTASRLVNQLLMLSAAESEAPETLQRRAVRLDETVTRAVETLSGRAAGKHIDLGFESNVPEAIVMGSPVAVREIAMNLLDNALRYTEDGGIVTCSIHARTGAIDLVVEDNGPGIPPAERDKVFERFYRMHNRDSGGCGLGLPIVREFAEIMGAKVSLEDPVRGRGLAVRVSFPAV